MALVRYEPFSLLERFQRELNRLSTGGDYFGEENGDGSSVVTSAWHPAVDVREEEKRFVIHADLPGVDPKDIDVTMENGVLTIRGERKGEKDEDRNGFRRVERVRGSFYRRFSLPDTADEAGIEAKGRDGVLEIVIPKHEKVQPRRIDVKA